MVVPWLGADRTSSWPPSAASLSAMFRWPEPTGVNRPGFRGGLSGHRGSVILTGWRRGITATVTLVVKPAAPGGRRW